MLERPDLLKQLVEKHAAHDTTDRKAAMQELEAMTPHTSQWDDGNEIPERNWVYRFVKRRWFNDFNAYAAELPLYQHPDEVQHNRQQAGEPELHQLN